MSRVIHPDPNKYRWVDSAVDIFRVLEDFAAEGLIELFHTIYMCQYKSYFSI